MSREQALVWLVENVTRWPVRPRCAIVAGNWYWMRIFNGDVFAVHIGQDEVITKSDWLAATENKARGEA